MDAPKLRELILYLASKPEADPGFLVTELCTLLFYCDFTAYRRLGKSITSCSYQKLPHGQVSRDIALALEKMQQDGDCREVQPDGSGPEQRRVLPQRPPKIFIFSDEELQLADQIVSELRNIGGDLGRDFIGWRVAAPNEVIPYETALVGDPMMSVSENEFKFCRRLS